MSKPRSVKSSTTVFAPDMTDIGRDNGMVGTEYLAEVVIGVSNSLESPEVLASTLGGRTVDVW